MVSRSLRAASDRFHKYHACCLLSLRVFWRSDRYFFCHLSDSFQKIEHGKKKRETCLTRYLLPAQFFHTADLIQSATCEVADKTPGMCDSAGQYAVIERSLIGQQSDRPACTSQGCFPMESGGDISSTPPQQEGLRHVRAFHKKCSECRRGCTHLFHQVLRAGCTSPEEFADHFQRPDSEYPDPAAEDQDAFQELLSYCR